MHDKIFKQGTCRGLGCGRGGILIVSHKHISNELSSEANRVFEGYNDCERADYRNIKRNLSFIMIRIFVKIIICEYLEADERLTLLCAHSCFWLQEKKKKNREAEKYRKKPNQT